MHGALRKVGFGALVAALVAAGLVLALGGGSEPAIDAGAEATPAASPESRRQPAQAEAERKADGALEISSKGNPIVWVRSGEEVDVHTQPGGPVIDTLADETEFGSTTVLAVFEERRGWAGVPTPLAGNGELGWVKLDGSRLKAGFTLREIVADLSDYQVRLLIDGALARTFTVSIGAPESSTPTGRFAVTDTFRGDLVPAYGCCAVALTAVQPNLPSGWLGGDRIAIHGTTGAIGQPISSGCLRAADPDVNALVNEVPPGAPVTIRE